MKNIANGVVITSDGFNSLTSAYLCIHLLRLLGCKLPVELWFWDHEHDVKYEKFFKTLGVKFCIEKKPNSFWRICGKCGMAG
jgi:hypothetical protein